MRLFAVSWSHDENHMRHLFCTPSTTPEQALEYSRQNGALWGDSRRQGFYYSSPQYLAPQYVRGDFDGAGYASNILHEVYLRSMGAIPPYMCRPWGALSSTVDDSQSRILENGTVHTRLQIGNCGSFAPPPDNSGGA